jgi:bidirectional [NiFe] hydrogenase diaphorase subunit
MPKREASMDAVDQHAVSHADKRWRAVDATMRRYGHSRNCLIETLHTAQEEFGYLDDQTLRYVAGALRLPLSKVYGVATFYHFFRIVPPARHQCIVCMGTSCYIQGAAAQLEAVRRACGIGIGERTADGALSLGVARCVGTCGLAPLIIIDRTIKGKLAAGEAARYVSELVGAS